MSYIMRIYVFTTVFLLPVCLQAGGRIFKDGGQFGLGVRNTVSAFSHGNIREWGYGMGGQFRIQLTRRVNTEWFADVLYSYPGRNVQRMDYHIGWSVMYYLIDTHGYNRKWTPLVLAGHCFDHTRLNITGNPDARASRWNSAVQAGIGFHYNMTPQIDLTTTAQYMLHLGRELHVHKSTDGKPVIEEHRNAAWEGHLLITFSMNYKFTRLWKS
ncbi:MAG: hypothetical protein KatS3mg031_0125 [Chitinophagales bacterium]|nr:MAG: hypothetical protein KatS3mg031_0125 [Chitinophagales bacterium]